MTDGHEVRCEGSERDRYGRLLGICQAGEVQLNAALVREGFAWAFVKYSSSYLGEEREARAAKRGVFAAENIPAWEFRVGRWGEAEASLLKQRCVIKGNVSRDGKRIYHMPWQRDYENVVMDDSKGKCWFCDEGEANGPVGVAQCDRVKLMTSDRSRNRPRSVDSERDVLLVLCACNKRPAWLGSKRSGMLRCHVYQ